jgi:hypothetical protein
MSIRNPWQGMITIVRLNWPYYAASAGVLVAALAMLVRSSSIPWQLGFALVAFGSAYFLFVSLGVSHFVYDRSDLYRWGWLNRALGGLDARAAVFCHTGFDDASLSLQSMYPEASWRVLDHFDPERMTEASIQRARALFPPSAETLPASFDRWPIDSHTVDLVLGFLAIHELRSEDERSSWFGEAKRCLPAGGRVVVVEHTRDLANFLAFGPGFMHFHSRASWRRCWERAGLRFHDEFLVNPFVRVFVVKRDE